MAASASNTTTTTTTSTTTTTGKTYIVEHLDPELGPWSALEYAAIARETAAAGGGVFCLSSLPPGFVVPAPVRDAAPEAFRPEHQAVEALYPGDEGRKRVCLLDPQAERDLCPEDGGVFEAFLFGGILGDDPPRDRTSELRKKGFEGRRLGPVQMTTDTAVRVTRMVVEEKYTLDKVPYLDFPDLKFNEHESTQMPFRYVAGTDGKPVMPAGMVDLIKKDADKSINDLF
ncbi:SAM-dependent RNA methyltransferase [Xylariomycetidae sp. FL0641]|nr:SAM-dependent RNA methyltransferase [Xylariomycetidae sp. FL0641]